MKPIYIPNYYSLNLFDHLLNDIKWLEATEARKEYFMSSYPRSYKYGGDGPGGRTYESSLYTLPVMELLNKLNNDFNCNYNVCFLNRYDNQKNQLGWHSDNSPEMNPEHPIAVISFGAEREIWWKNKDATGEIPKDQRQVFINLFCFFLQRFKNDDVL